MVCHYHVSHTIRIPVVSRDIYKGGPSNAGGHCYRPLNMTDILGMVFTRRAAGACQQPTVIYLLKLTYGSKKRMAKHQPLLDLCVTHFFV